MKTNILIAAVGAITMMALAATAQAQNGPKAGNRGMGMNAQNCPIRQQIGGPGWALSPEQKLERQKLAQALIAELRQKQQNGTITDVEKAWLERAEKNGGMCINGVPRGPQGGKGAQGMGRGPQGGKGGQGMGNGFCWRRGMCKAQQP